MKEIELKVQFNVYLPAELVRAIKHRAIDEGHSLSALVESVMKAHLTAVSGAMDSGPTVARASGELVVMPVWYPRDVEAAHRFVRALGLQPRIVSDEGTWSDYTADGGGLVALHAGSATPRTELSFEYRGDLGAFAERLEEAGFTAVLVDEAYNRTLLVSTPDGWQLWINEAQADLHGFHRAD